MPSPFPGMNPYLEQDRIWKDFHQTFMITSREVLREQVRPHYYVTVEEDLFVRESADDSWRRVGQADAAITGHGPIILTDGGTAIMEPPVRGSIPDAIEETRHAFLEIRNRADDGLVTVFELLSPTNKRSGKDRDRYLDKRLRILNSSVHLVEIDFLRGWARMPADGVSACDYLTIVSRAEERPDAGLWPIGLRESLPVLPIPLRLGDPDAQLDLKLVLDRVYDRSGYEDFVYKGQPRPPLSPADAAWARQFVPEPFRV